MQATVEHDHQTASLVSWHLQLRFCLELKIGDHLHNEAKTRQPNFQTNPRPVDLVTPKKVNQGVTPKCVNTNFGNATLSLFASLPCLPHLSNKSETLGEWSYAPHPPLHKFSDLEQTCRPNGSAMTSAHNLCVHNKLPLIVLPFILVSAPMPLSPSSGTCHTRWHSSNAGFQPASWSRSPPAAWWC